MCHIAGENCFEFSNENLLWRHFSEVGTLKAGSYPCTIRSFTRTIVYLNLKLINLPTITAGIVILAAYGATTHWLSLYLLKEHVRIKIIKTSMRAVRYLTDT